VLLGECMFAQTAEHMAQALVRRRRIRIDGQRALVEMPCRGEVVVFQQCVAEIDQRAQVARMMLERFVIGQRCRYDSRRYRAASRGSSLRLSAYRRAG
jgi:hypothetical protein